MMGLAVHSVDAHGSKLGVVANSLIVAVDGHPVSNYEEYKRYAVTPQRKKFSITVEQDFASSFLPMR